MSQKRRPRKNRGATVATVLCFVAAIAIVGTYTFMGSRNTQQEEEFAQAEEAGDKTKDKAESEEAGASQELVLNTRDDAGDQADDADDDDDDADDADDAAGGQSDSAAKAAGNEPAGSGAAASTSGSVQANLAKFDERSGIIWPVNGPVIMSYSMDKTVYFSTLDQYKYNPAMIIEGAEGEPVACGAQGTVKSIDVTAQTGTTVHVDIGNGYELIYGQLMEVPVKVGDPVDVGSTLGYVSQPTKYYSREGCNVYLEMRKDGEPVNPADYLTE